MKTVVFFGRRYVAKACGNKVAMNCEAMSVRALNETRGLTYSTGAHKFGPMYRSPESSWE